MNVDVNVKPLLKNLEIGTSICRPRGEGRICIHALPIPVPTYLPTYRRARAAPSPSQKETWKEKIKRPRANQTSYLSVFSRF